MAKNKVARETKAKDGLFTEKAVAKGSTSKAAAPHKAAGPKLTELQREMLQRVADAGQAGYRAEKKTENKTLEALLKHKLVKRGKTRMESGNYHYTISNAGKKHKPIWEVFQEITARIPDEEWAKLPVDGAEQHDHYIYGTPKRSTS
jgi:hypothetical protein